MTTTINNELAHSQFFADMEQMRRTNDEAYRERNRLVAFLARLYPSGIKRTEIPGWDRAWDGCVYIDLPTGQASWHYHDRDAPLFAGLPPYQGEWDGHTTEEKYARLAALRMRIEEEAEQAANIARDHAEYDRGGAA